MPSALYTCHFCPFPAKKLLAIVVAGLSSPKAYPDIGVRSQIVTVMTTKELFTSYSIVAHDLFIICAIFVHVLRMDRW